MKRGALLAWLLCAGTVCGTARAADVPELLRSLGADEPDVPHLLLHMASDPLYQSRLLENAGAPQRALTDTLVSFLRLTEPMARRHLPQLYEVRDQGLAVDERPPAWADVRLAGVRLFLPVALDADDALDRRLRRELEAEIAGLGRPRPAAVGGLVLPIEEWWIEHGDQPRYTHDPSRIPDLQPWLDGLERNPGDEGAWGGARMLVDLDDHPLARRMLLDRLGPSTHAHLAAECMLALRWSVEDLDSLGVARPQWDPDLGHMTGHRITELWRRSLDVLDRVLPVAASGADADAEATSRLAWWRRGRFEARYWRDATQAPDLSPWLGNVAQPPERGGVPAASWVRNIFVAQGFRSLVLDRLGPEHAALVSELMAFLPLDEEQATAAGFELFLVVRDLRTDEEERVVGLRWEDMRSFVRELLHRLVRLRGESPPAGNADSDWIAWWSDHAGETTWYRDPAARPRVPNLPLEPERGRVR